jgi:predicted transcriptional regulator of viral defense system
MGRNTLKDRLFFSVRDAAKAYGITLASARVLCTRNVQRGDFIRLKKDFYILERNWERYGTREFFQVSNFLQVPSYISCMTALAYYGITTQTPRGWYENISQKRSTTMEVRGTVFMYHKIRPTYFFGFAKQDNFFIASREKAFLDAAYLSSLGRYALDWSSLDLDALDKAKIIELMVSFPERVRQKVQKACRI